jgi:hypothetical protein
MDKLRVNIMQFYLSVSRFTDFYNAVMNCMPIFAEDEPTTCEGRLTPRNDEDICIICFERRNNTILNCQHNFCESCIKIWLLEKDNHCPVCRSFVKIGESDDATFCERRWSFIDLMEYSGNDYLVFLDELFVSAFENLIKDKI